MDGLEAGETLYSLLLIMLLMHLFLLMMLVLVPLLMVLLKDLELVLRLFTRWWD